MPRQNGGTILYVPPLTFWQSWAYYKGFRMINSYYPAALDSGEIVTKPKKPPLNPGELTGLGDISLEDAKKMLATVREQFFDPPPEGASDEDCRLLAARLLEDVLVPLNREFAIVSVKGKLMIADLASLKTPTVRDRKARKAWLPSAEPALMTTEDFKLLLADRQCWITKRGKWREVSGGKLSLPPVSLFRPILAPLVCRFVCRLV